jgi:hypothetical protein
MHPNLRWLPSSPPSKRLIECNGFVIGSLSQDLLPLRESRSIDVGTSPIPLDQASIRSARPLHRGISLATGAALNHVIRGRTWSQTVRMGGAMGVRIHDVLVAKTPPTPSWLARHRADRCMRCMASAGVSGWGYIGGTRRRRGKPPLGTAGPHCCRRPSSSR